jgi:MFS family permease
MLRMVVIFFAVFLFSLHFAATLYINSSFLEHFFTLEMVGFWFILGALANIIIFFKAPALLRALGLRRFIFVFLILTFVATIGAAYAFSPVDAAIFFIIYAASATMVYYALDLMLEDISTNKRTGELRGLYLTLLNTAIAIGPLLITAVGTDGKFKYFYLTAAVILIPLMALLFFFFKPRHRREAFPNHSLHFRSWWRRNDIRRVTLARLVLEIFYGFMTIYMPIYLHTRIGFAWFEIGIIFSIMLLPFLIFEWPAGVLADRKYGEKEIMSLGFTITAGALLFMPFIGKDALWWVAVLFTSRIGAAFIEVTTETYFFKKISVNDTGFLGIFRLGRPFGIISGSALGALSLMFLPFNQIFFIISACVLLGLRQSLKIRDTL